MTDSVFTVIGHRGNGAGADENTAGSCLAAIRAGAARVEIDVRLGRGEVITAHDHGRTDDTLANVLDQVQAPLIIHVKEGTGRIFHRAYYRKLVDEVAKQVRGREVVLSSFSPGMLRYCRRQHPELATAFATVWAGYDLHLAAQLGIREMHTFPWFLTARAVRLAKRRQLPLVVYTPRNTPAMKQRLGRLGVRQVMTDDIAFWRS